jgi:hypothetical protein
MPRPFVLVALSLLAACGGDPSADAPAADDGTDGADQASVNALAATYTIATTTAAGQLTKLALRSNSNFVADYTKVCDRETGVCRTLHQEGTFVATQSDSSGTVGSLTLKAATSTLTNVDDPTDKTDGTMDMAPSWNYTLHTARAYFPGCKIGTRCDGDKGFPFASSLDLTPTDSTGAPTGDPFSLKASRSCTAPMLTRTHGVCDASDCMIKDSGWGYPIYDCW